MRSGSVEFVGENTAYPAYATPLADLRRAKTVVFAESPSLGYASTIGVPPFLMRTRTADSTPKSVKGGTNARSLSFSGAQTPTREGRTTTGTPLHGASQSVGTAPASRQARRAQTIGVDLARSGEWSQPARAARTPGASPGVGGTSPSFHLGSPTEAPADRRYRRAKTTGFDLSGDVSVGVVAPGGGTGMNANVYSALGQKMKVSILGQSRAMYDRYPKNWPEGAPAPNLESFGKELVKDLHHFDCLVLGSRGGQVVLPTLWQARGEEVPPAVVINGGCAMDLPDPVPWPRSAVTFLLLGGQDYFGGNRDAAAYVADTKAAVPRENGTTAILYVHEMGHMPQSQILMAIIHHMILAVISWKTTQKPPNSKFEAVLKALVAIGANGRLLHTSGPGSWVTSSFSPAGVSASDA